MDHIEYAYTSGMSDDDVENRLREAQTGVLSLCDDADARAVPLAHYYDGENLYFRLGKTDDSEKWDAIERTETVTYVVYDAEPTDGPDELDSWSIHVTGRLRELPDADHSRFDTAEINRRFAPIRVFDEPIEDIDIAIVELTVETLTGRTTQLA
ncbi:pyridoxamine 5'-phosphate oxidase family protein [Salinibaculum salinum]|uniref:pyridoxamine 5'-phosphate oxidase family protein n=1 Tax=Salinibaculum salinum TaxID=3131996 RepID=UPI0030ECB4DE